MLTIDGSSGEGGGQIVRTSLALSLLTGKPFRIERIRARRARPGLRRQHLTAVRAAAEVGRAQVDGAKVGSSTLRFVPGKPVAGNYRFSIGTAGSATLVFQAILPALITAPGRSQLVFEGGTHNPLAPPFDFIEKAFLPLIRRMGPAVTAVLERPGFYPAGGGRFTVTIEPVSHLSPIELLERGPVLRREARAVVSALPATIAERELSVVEHELRWSRHELLLEEVERPRGPGNAICLEIESEHVTEVFTGVGERHVRAETVAMRAVAEARAYLEAGVPVGPHLADQLIAPLAMAGAGSFRTMPLSMHSKTQLEIVRTFLGVVPSVREQADGSVIVAL
jgi:RNA 3'-terminal phosphate cyclase (ATP)